MDRIKYLAVSASGTGETLVNALTGIGEKKRLIKKLQYIPDHTTSSAPSSRSTRIRAYRDQDQVVDAAITSFQYSVYSGVYSYDFPSTYELDLPLERGQGFKVGLYNSGATPVGNLQMIYEDRE